MEEELGGWQGGWQWWVWCLVILESLLESLWTEQARQCWVVFLELGQHWDCLE